MKKIKKIFAFFLTLICLNLCFVEGIAAGPLDGQVIDGSLLTSEESAFDEKPLLPENPFEEGIMPYGTYLSNGISGITDQGGGVVYVSGHTNCYQTSDKVQVYLYLEKLSNGGWSTIRTHSNAASNTYQVSAGINYLVQKGYYYRVKGTHLAKKGSKVESCITCTLSLIHI